MKTTRLMMTAVCIAVGLAVRAASAQDVFDAGPQVYTVHKTATSDTGGTDSKPHKGPVVRLRLGEIAPVFDSTRFSGNEEAFYLPPEATGIVQLIVERKGSKVTYYLKALHKGSTVGGAVMRAWLDKDGFHPRNAADEARIQQAVRHNPLYIEVH